VFPLLTVDPHRQVLGIQGPGLKWRLQPGKYLLQNGTVSRTISDNQKSFSRDIVLPLSDIGSYPAVARYCFNQCMVDC